MKIARNINLRKRDVKLPKISDFILISLVPISVLSLALLLSSSTFAETSTKTNVSVEVKQGCNVTAKNNEHTGTISNGTYSEIGNPTEFTIACNGNNKYDIYAVGFTNDTEGNNKLVGDKDSDNKYDIITGTAQSGDISNWAFKLSESSEGLTIVTNDDSNNNFTNYSNIPGSSTKVASRAASTLNNTKDTFKSTYAAYISKSQPADTYTGKVKYTLMDQGTTPITNYSITYDINGGDSSSLPSPNPQTGSTMDSTITLSDTTPTKSGYEFLYWCTSNPGSNSTCSGTSYDAGASYLLSGDATRTFYATWGKPSMQSFTCSSLSSGASTTLRDARDNNEYTVAKLKDGKCWMTQNLRIQDKNLTSTDSDVSNNFSLPASISNDFNSTTVANVHLDSTYGGYYNWYAATAGTGTSSMSAGNNAPSSICPKGWKLPTSGTTSSDFSNLTKAYGGSGNNEFNTTVYNALKSGTIPNFLLSGTYGSDSLAAVGTMGRWWSSAAYRDNGYAYYLRLDTDGGIWPLEYYAKHYGLSVRCVAK